MSTRPPSPRRVWALATVALVLAFVAGALSGAAWDRMHGRDRRPVPRGPGHYSEVLRRRYDLSGDQAKRIEAIVARRRPRVDSLMATVQPQLRAAFDSTNSEIRGVLTPGQRQRFDDDQARRRKQLQRPGAPIPGGPGEPGAPPPRP